MLNKRVKREGFSKKLMKSRCYMCNNHRGLLKNLLLCRSCFYENVYLTTWR